MRKKLRCIFVYCIASFLFVSVGCEPTETIEGKISLNITNTPKITESSPSISSDGKKVVFEANLQGNKEILLRNLETGEITNISYSPANDYQPSISASGKTIVFMSDRTGNPEVYVVNIADVFYVKGLQEKKDGNNNRAVLDFHRAINVDPFHKASHHQLGTIYDGRKQYDQTIKEFGIVANIYTKDLIRSLKTQLSTAAQAQQKDNIEKQRLLKLANDTINAHHNLAVAYIRNEDKKGAANVHYILGTIFDRIELKEFAVTEFKKAIDIDPSPSAYIYNSLGKLYGETEDYEEAKRMLEKAVQIDPNCVPAYCNLGLVYLKQGLQERAKDHFDKALRIEPNCPDVYQNLAVYYYEKQDYQKALEEWKTLSKVNPNYPNLRRNINLAEQQMQQDSLTVGQRQKLSGFNKGQAIMSEVTTKEKNDTAVVDSDKALDMHVGDPEIFYQKGLKCHNEKQFKRAIYYYTLAIKNNPRFDRAYMNRGIDNAALGQLTEAISDFTKVIEIYPRYATAYFNRGLAYHNKGEYDQAISDYDKAIEINPKYADAYNNLGNAYLKKGEYDQAVSNYSKAIEINPREARAYSNRGIAYYYKGEYDKAWEDTHTAQSFEYQIKPEFLKALRQASGREK